MTAASPKAKRQAVARKEDREATRIASWQWGALTRRQALKAGLRAHQVAYRVKTGQWREVAQGVYVVAGAPARWEQEAMIACLAGPDGTVASHLTAAALSVSVPSRPCPRWPSRPTPADDSGVPRCSGDTCGRERRAT